MADGFNSARAMRIAEIMNDFRSLQYYIAGLSVTPRPEDYYLEGYTLLRHCVAEAQALLAQGYEHNSQNPDGDQEAEKTLLKQVSIDASVRRFRCPRAYMRAIACRRWSDARHSILQGQSPHAGNAQQLQDLNDAVRTDVTAVTDQVVYQTLRDNDQAQEKFLNDDPTLGQILALI
jgi:hypothetical protein